MKPTRTTKRVNVAYMVNPSDYIPLVWWLTNRVHRYGESKYEIFSAASLGLLYAARKYDESKGKFSAYAIQWMRGTVSRWRQESRSARWIGPSGRRASLKLRQRIHRLLLFGELGSDFVHGHARVFATVKGITTERIEANEDQSALSRALKSLPYRHREILVARFGLLGHRGLTLNEVGRLFGITGGRVRQIEIRAILALQSNKELQKYA